MKNDEEEETHLLIQEQIVCVCDLIFDFFFVSVLFGVQINGEYKRRREIKITEKTHTHV